ncbi:low-density lipoprotein receptor-related protein 5-like [Nasonia vitripennis]|uniref:Uncharacterized protein n=1 Tax=Nasonia vitripennis TaxID=7425 RepID=A0A7M7GLF6_NASVI|nr:low-density lipoprotein receptor-related protein 5-like [Nasonia vitripennis]
MGHIGNSACHADPCIQHSASESTSCILQRLLKMQQVPKTAYLLLLLLLWTVAGCDAALSILFNAKNGAVYHVPVNLENRLETPIAVSNTTIPTTHCQGDGSLGRANIVDLDYDESRQRVLWMSWNERLYSSQLPISNATGGNRSDELLFWYDYYDYVQFSRRRIAWDPVGEKLYSVDTFWNPTVEVVDLTGKHRSIILAFGTTGKWKDYVFEGKMPADVEKDAFVAMTAKQELPMDLVLDPGTGVMFIRTNDSWSSRIHRANMDGTSLKLLITDAGKIVDDSCRIDVDRVNKRIYWNDREKGSIESADYDGNRRLTVVKAANPVALAVDGNVLVWSQNTTDPSLRGHLSVCKLTDNTCDPDEIRDTSLSGINDVPYKLKAVPDQAQQIANPCSTNNGNCQQICLLKPSTDPIKPNPSHGCGCKIGYRLSANSRDCEPILRYLVYESDNYLRARSLEPLERDNETRPYALFPSQVVDNVVARDQLVAIDYDPKADKMLVLGCKTLKQIDLDDNLRGCWRVARNSSDCYKHMAYDWESGKVYTTKVKGMNGEYELGVVDVPSGFRRFGIVVPAILRSIDRPLSLVVHPKTGYLYLLTFSNATNASVVSRMNVGGLDYIVLTIAEALDARGLAVDSLNDRLYWFAESGRVGHSDLGGNDVKVLPVEAPVLMPDSILVDRDWLYVKNETSIWRMNKKTGADVSCLVPEVKVSQHYHAKLKSTMSVVARSPGSFSYGDDYQITKSACKVYCAYQEFAQYNATLDEKFCKCPNLKSD